jgi:hypothetical protein
MVSRINRKWIGWVSIFAVAIGAIIAGSGVSWSAQADTLQIAREFLAKHEKRLHDIERDLSDIAIAQKAPSFEYDIADNLRESASESEDSLTSIGVLVDVYAAVSCDRAKIRPMILSHVSLQSKLLDLRISDVSRGVANTSVPGTAVTGAHLRDQLRAAKDTLDLLGDLRQ